MTGSPDSLHFLEKHPEGWINVQLSGCSSAVPNLGFSVVILHAVEPVRIDTSIMASGSVALRLWQRNLTIWNAAIHCTLVVRDILIVSPR
jgi:hypothetical protein